MKIKGLVPDCTITGLNLGNAVVSITLNFMTVKSKSIPKCIKIQSLIERCHVRIVCIRYGDECAPNHSLCDTMNLQRAE